MNDKERIERLGSQVRTLEKKLAATKKELRGVRNTLASRDANTKAHNERIVRKNLEITRREEELAAKQNMSMDEVSRMKLETLKRQRDEAREECKRLRTELGIRRAGDDGR